MNQPQKIEDAKPQRKEIYIGKALRRLLFGRKGSLTTWVNLIADRYLGMIERGDAKGTTVVEDDLYRLVLSEYRRPLEARDIAGFPAAVEDWCRRNPAGPGDNYYAAALAGIKCRSYVNLVALIDRLEKTT